MRIQLLAAALAAVFSTGAMADSPLQGTVHMHDLRVTVTDLTPNDGVDAGFGFTDDWINHPMVHTTGTIWSSASSRQFDIMGYDGLAPGVGDLVSAVDGARHLSASASMGNGTSGLDLFAALSFDQIKMGGAQSWSAFTADYALAPHTSVTVSATLSWDVSLRSGDSDTGPMNGWVSAGGGFSVQNPLASHGSSHTIRWVGTDHGETDVQLTFANDGIYTQYGEFEVSAAVSGEYVPTPVPEPTTAGLLLGGLALLGASLRKRRTR